MRANRVRCIGERITKGDSVNNMNPRLDEDEEKSISNIINLPSSVHLL